MSIRWVGSPNYWQGRSQAVREVVIHWMVGTLASTDATFQNTATSTSAHYGIENGIVHQYVRESDAAWHSLQANPWTIGIEHSAAPGRPASDQTYATTIQLCADICRRYNLNPDIAIVPHNKYVATQCPGTMDLNRIKQGVKNILGGEEMVGSGDNWFNRFKKMMIDSRGEERGNKVTRAEFTPFINKPLQVMVESVSDHPERDQNVKDANLGRRARRDKWDKQIFDLQDIVKNLNERIAQMIVQMEELRKDSANKDLAEALQKRLEITSAELDKTVKKMKTLEDQQAADTKAGDSFIRRLGQLISKYLP